MAVVTLDGGQSASALGGQTLAYVGNLVSLQVQGAPDQLIQAMLTQVVREFYTKSTAWRETVGPYNVLPNVSGFVPLNPVSQNARLQFVLAAFLFPINGSLVPNHLAPVTRQPRGGTPQLPHEYFMEKMDVMQLFPYPDSNYGPVLYVYASLVPTPNAATLPDISYTHHLDALTWGTLARLYMMPKKPWTDKNLAAEYSKKFRQEILLWRDVAGRGQGPSDTRFRFPSFAGRGGSQVLPRATG